MTSPTESPPERSIPGTSRARPTRISWAWATLLVGVLLGIALVDFLAQNTRSVQIEFFSASGHVPIVVALLVAALAGAALVLTVGVARIGQLRRGLRRRGATREGMRTPGSDPESLSENKGTPGEVDESGQGFASPANAPPSQ
jgi:uncharacterized integral membrane protein